MECASVEKGKTIKSLKSSSLVKNENFDRVWRLAGAFAIAVLPAIGENLELLHGGLCDQPGSGVMQVISTGTL
jgi:muconolactone delta-isomerase